MFFALMTLFVPVFCSDTPSLETFTHHGYSQATPLSANASSEVRSCVKVPNSNFFEIGKDIGLDSAFVGPY